MNTTKTRYRTPSVSREVDVSLCDFDDDQIIEYLRHHGYSVGGKEVVPGDSNGVMQPSDDLVIERDDLNRVFTLALCGQKEAARDTVIQMVERHIGRSLR